MPFQFLLMLLTCLCVLFLWHYDYNHSMIALLRSHLIFFWMPQAINCHAYLRFSSSWNLVFKHYTPNLPGLPLYLIISVNVSDHKFNLHILLVVCLVVGTLLPLASNFPFSQLKYAWIFEMAFSTLPWYGYPALRFQDLLDYNHFAQQTYINNVLII
jgi:hypothetical protein